jgi:hypothetical protein
VVHLRQEIIITVLKRLDLSRQCEKNFSATDEMETKRSTRILFAGASEITIFGIGQFE